MQQALHIIRQTFTEHPAAVLAFSGGTDSTVLLDIVYRHTTYRPPLVWADSQMEYPETEAHVRAVAAQYGATLHVAKAERTPTEQWARQGWPMLGKLSASLWNRNHPDHGFRCNVSGCCRAMKIKPARTLTKTLHSDCQLTGQRGNQDDRLRGRNAYLYGPLHYVKADKLYISNPLQGWTETMVLRYRAQHDLPQHPAKARGAITIGCMYCGGGAQFTNSGFRVLRHVLPAAWRWFMVEAGAGAIVLALKYDQPLPIAEAAIEELGGLAHLADTKPWLFDFLRLTPLQGYTR